MKNIYYNSKGHAFIKLDIIDMFKIGGLGICDSCNETIDEGNLIPVLNSVYCNYCFEKWTLKAKYHQEDKIYEEAKTKQYLGILNDFK